MLVVGFGRGLGLAGRPRRRPERGNALGQPSAGFQAVTDRTEGRAEGVATAAMMTAKDAGREPTLMRDEG